MKLFVAIAIFFWLICGLAGAWMMGDLDSGHWKTIARGPITLIQAFNDDPVTIPSGH
jgi:hypothetical protein